VTLLKQPFVLLTKECGIKKGQHGKWSDGQKKKELCPGTPSFSCLRSPDPRLVKYKKRQSN